MRPQPVWTSSTISGIPRLFGQAAHLAQPLVGCRNHAALALHHLKDNAGGEGDAALGVVQHPPQVVGEGLPVALRKGRAVQVGVRHEVSFGHQSGDAGLRPQVAHERQCPVRLPVIRPVERNYGPPSGCGFDQLERGLDGVRATGTAELDAGATSKVPRQAREQRFDEVILDRCEQVQRLQRQPGVEVLSDGVRRRGVVVPQGERPRVAQTIEVPGAVDVDEIRALAARDHERESARKCGRSTRTPTGGRAYLGPLVHSFVVSSDLRIRSGLCAGPR